MRTHARIMFVLISLVAPDHGLLRRARRAPEAAG
jgi:hypothetical protein